MLKFSGLGDELSLIFLLLFVFCANFAFADDQLRYLVDLQGVHGQRIGTATLTQAVRTQPGIQVSLKLSGLKPGLHAMHIHEFAKCAPPDFVSAGAHFNPSGAHHGQSSPVQPHPHAGDLPNIEVLGDGTSHAVVTNPYLTLSDGPFSVFSNGGTSLIIHAGVDDMETDPAGNAGARIGCGEINRVTL